VGIFLLILSGFFFYTANMVAFFRSPEIPVFGKVMIMAIFSVPALAFLLLGAWRRPAGARWRAVGVTLLSAAGFTAFGAYTMWAVLTSPATAKFASPETVRAFSDYLWGSGCTAVYALVGGGLMWFSRGKKLSP